MCKFSESVKDKLGNALIYMADRVDDLSKTKALKLLYLMEERMVLKYHMPFLAIPYEVWQAGPVAKDVFVDLSDGPYLLKDYVKTELRHNGTYILSIKPFSDDEFSDCEIAMMDDILKKYGKMTAADLVDETHKKGTLWYQEASQNNLLEAFNNHECNNSDIKIDFTKAMAPCAAEFYKESLDFHQTANLLSMDMLKNKHNHHRPHGGKSDEELAAALSTTSTDWDEVEHADLSQIDYSKYKPYQSAKTQKIIEKWL